MAKARSFFKRENCGKLANGAKLETLAKHCGKTNVRLLIGDVSIRPICHPAAKSASNPFLKCGNGERIRKDESWA
jgi:hypothetical protein